MRRLSISKHAGNQTGNEGGDSRHVDRLSPWLIANEAAQRARCRNSVVPWTTNTEPMSRVG